MTFRFQKLTLEQFRCFEHLELSLEEDLTVLFAENGGGKTAVLTALASGLRPFQTGAPRALQLDAQRDARKVTLDERGRREAAGACTLAWTAKVGEGQPVAWSNTVNPAPWPVSFRYEDVLGFTSGGRMYVRTDVSVSPQLRQALEVALEDQPGPPIARSTLNLNHPALREARAAVIETEEDEPPATPAQRQPRIAALIGQARREGFVSARLAALNGQIGVGR